MEDTRHLRTHPPSTNHDGDNRQTLRPFLTVSEAAEILSISRNTAYLATKRYRATNGAEGLPVVQLGGCLRVPRAALERMAGIGLDTTNAA